MPHLKNVKNTHRAVTLLKLQASSCNFTKSISPPWVFFTFFNEMVPNLAKHDKYFMRAWEGIVKVAIFLKFPTILLTIIEKTWIRYFPCEKWRCVSQTRLSQFSNLLQMETKTLVFLFTNRYIAISFMKSRCQPTFLPSRIHGYQNWRQLKNNVRLFLQLSGPSSINITNDWLNANHLSSVSCHCSVFTPWAFNRKRFDLAITTKKKLEETKIQNDL